MSVAPTEAFSNFCRLHYPAVYASARRRVVDRGAAEDIASEVFRVAWQHSLAGQELTVPWVYVVACNLIGNEYRRSSRSRALTDKVEQTFHASSWHHDDSNGDVRRALSMLTAPEKEILFMAYWEDLSGLDIAKVLGCTPATAWVRLSRARSSLRRHLTPPDGSGEFSTILTAR